jgi:predicted small integral membrane protein
MSIRYLKMALVLFTALMCILYALQNLVNLQAAHQVVAMVMQMADHEYYPRSVLPAIHSPVLSGLGLAVIIALEMTAGLLAGKGALDMWRHRHADGEQFQFAKRWSIAGCGLAVLIWFGLFGVIGGAWFQMWQTDLGSSSLNGAFQYAVSAGLVMVFVNMQDA